MMPEPPACPRCGEERLIEPVRTVVLSDGLRVVEFVCLVCSHRWKLEPEGWSGE